MNKELHILYIHSTLHSFYSQVCF